MVSNPGADDEGSDAISVSFFNVEFLDNGLVYGAPDVLKPMQNKMETGGAISAGPKCVITVDDSQFLRNKARRGGAIHVEDGSLIVRGSVFLENIAEFSGGAVHVEQIGVYPEDKTPETALTIVDCKFRDNEALTILPNPIPPVNSAGGPLESSQFKVFQSPGTSGGAVVAVGLQKVVIERSIFERNKGGAGGALNLVRNKELQLNSSIFEHNTLIGDDNEKELQQGGAVFALFSGKDGKCVMEDCVFRRNSGAYGGAVHMVTVPENTVQIKHCEFTRNLADLYGGAVVLRNMFSSTWTDCIFEQNDALAGGALLLTNGAGASFDSVPIGSSFSSSNFTKNTADYGGGIMCLGCGKSEVQTHQMQQCPCEATCIQAFGA